MKFHKQEHLYIPGQKEQRGSCYPTVYACLLDLDLHKVPYFHLMYWSKEERENVQHILHYEKAENPYSDIAVFLNLWDVVRELWLMGQGYKEVKIKDIDQWLSENKDTPYLVTGTSSRNIGHVVIYMNGELYHDPHPSNEGLVKIDYDAYSYLKKII